jgi:hypothetical protein
MPELLKNNSPLLSAVAAVKQSFHLCMALMPGVLVLLAACTAPSTETVPPGQEKLLKIGQILAIAGEPLKVKFAGVVSESRCPTGALCIRQGEVICLLEVTHAGSTKSLNVTQPGETRDPARVTFEKYEFVFGVEPYPEAGREISKADYRLRLTVNKTLP